MDSIKEWGDAGHCDLLSVTGEPSQIVANVPKNTNTLSPSGLKQAECVGPYWRGSPCSLMISIPLSANQIRTKLLLDSAVGRNNSLAVRAEPDGGNASRIADTKTTQLSPSFHVPDATSI